MPSAAELRGWLADKKAAVHKEGDRKGESMYTPKQIQVAALIVERVCEEMGDDAKTTTPLYWCVHGGPGVGKSHTLKLMRELFNFIGFRSDVEYVMTALQAVMAEQLEGDTLHHSLGVTPSQFKKSMKANDGGATKREMEISKFLEQCRWLVIDEISMISAQLLSEVDNKLRRAIRDVEATKKDENLLERPFGGINVIFCGDFWQLDPPSGTPLASIPSELLADVRQFAAAPDVQQGHAFFGVKLWASSTIVCKA